MAEDEAVGAMGEKIRILEIVGEIDGGGVGSVVYNYFSHMNLSGIQCDILAFENSKNESGQHQLLEEPFRKLGIRVIYIKHRNKGYRDHFKHYQEILSRNHYDIVHCHFGIWSTPYLYYANKQGIHVRIAHSHVAITNYKGVKNFLLEHSRPLLNLVCTHRFACGQAAGEYLWGKKKFHIMPNAIDLNKFKFDRNIREQYRKKLGLDENVLCIGSIGRFCEQKNQSYIIDILNNLTEVSYKMIFVGDGPDQDRIRNAVNSRMLTDNVIFLGLRNDIYGLMQAMDVLLMPSIYEGLPVVAIEAQAVGLPVIMSNNIAAEAKILDTSYFLPLEDRRKWKAEILKISKLSYDREEADISVMNAGFDITDQAEKLRKFYLCSVR